MKDDLTHVVEVVLGGTESTGGPGSLGRTQPNIPKFIHHGLGFLNTEGECGTDVVSGFGFFQNDGETDPSSLGRGLNYAHLDRGGPRNTVE